MSQCKVYQARLETYQKLLPHVPQHQANVARVTKVIKEKTEQLQQKHEKLQQKEKDLIEKEQLENEV